MKLRLAIFCSVWLSLLAAAGPITDQLRWGIPCSCDQIIEHNGYVIGYSRKHRQALWICYTLTAKQLEGPQVRRRDRFRADPALLLDPVQPGDYRQSGYDKGHLAAAADMTYSQRTMDESFFMTNITPQLPGCNRGIWKRLETACRLIARRERRICIITGPLFLPGDKSMGDTQITIPSGFFKVVLDLTPPRKAIGFIVPNRSDKARVKSFAVSVDDAELAAGMDFFSALPDKQEKAIEAVCDPAAWGL